MAGPWMSLSTSLNVGLTLGQTLRKKGCMPEPKWGVAFGTMNSGFNFIGPFDEDSKIDEDEFSERCVAFGDEYHYFQIWSPDDFEKDQYGDLRLKEDKDA